MNLTLIRRLLPGTLLALLLLLGTAACAEEDPAADEMAEEMNGEMEEEMAQDDIVAVAVADGRFTTLASALQSTGLVETLQGQGPFTVFAPTDDAFAALPAGTLEGLSNEELTNILTYHVASGSMMADAVSAASTIETVQGSALTVAVGDDGTVRINDAAAVVVPNVEASNGVIHVIDAVLMPPADDGM